MNPYLKIPARSPLDLFFPSAPDQEMSDSPESNDRIVRGFSPDYEPDQSATIRAVRPPRQEPADKMSTSPPTHLSVASTSNTGPSGRGSSKDVREGTFLQDSSDNDPDATSVLSSTDVTERQRTTGSQAPPSSVARDMALVAEYERVHSKGSPATTKTDLTQEPSIADHPRSPAESSSDIKQTILTTHLKAKDEEWVMLTPSKSAMQQDVKGNRVWLEESSSEDDVAFPVTSSQLSNGKVYGSTETVYKSATSLPTVQVDGEEQALAAPQRKRVLSDAETFQSFDVDNPTLEEILPSEGDREKAQKIYYGNEEFIPKEKAAAWLGEDNPISLRTLVAYVELYNFTNLNILAALRLMCGRLVLKAESQQVDRILVKFSQHWCKCNPNHGFKGTGKSVPYLLQQVS